MPAGTLSGEVYKKIAGKWRLVLTASGTPVVDNWKMPRDWRETVHGADALKYTLDGVIWLDDYTITRDHGGNITFS